MFWMTLALAQEIQAGATLPDAAVVHITPEGLDGVGGLVSGFLPEDGLAVDPVDVSGGGGFCLIEYSLQVDNLNIGLEIADTTIIPDTDTLYVSVDAIVNVNDALDEFVLTYDAACLDGVCPGYVDPFPVNLALPISLAVVTDPMTGAVALDATLGQVGVTNGLMDTDVHLDCGLQNLQNALDLVGLSLYDFIIGFAEDFLVEEINNQAAEIEATIEDAFSAAVIDESFEILDGVALDVSLAPRDVVIDPNGVVLIMEAAIDAPPADCIAAFDPGTSPFDPSAPPSIANEPPGTQAALHASENLVNQGLYAAWRSGILCQQLSEGEFGGFSIDTSLLGLVGGDPYQELFPETEPMEIRTVPTQRLTADFAGPHDLDVPIDDLEVLFFADLDGRRARALGVSLSPNVGVDLDFDPTTGELAANVLFGDDLGLELAGDSMTPGHEEEVLESVGGALGGIVDTLLGSLLGDSLAFGLPALDGGIGLTDLEVTPSGGGAWLGVYAEVGPVEYESAGCEEGCSGGGCSNSPGSMLWAGGLLALFLRRRR